MSTSQPPVNTKQESTIPATSVPLIIVFRSFNFDFVSAEPLSFNWLPFEGASKYILMLRGSKRIIWIKEVAANVTTVIYDGETLLQPGEDYILTVEIDFHKSYANYKWNREDEIALYVREGLHKIEQIDLSNHLKLNIITQLDSFLIARGAILDTIRGVLKQGSYSKVICFLNEFLHQGSAFRLLTDACSFEDIEDALCNIASQLASAYLTLSNYLYFSSASQRLSIEYFEQAVELTSLVKAVDKLETGAVQNKSVLFLPNRNIRDCKKCQDLIDDYGPARACMSRYCKGCLQCRP